MSLAGQWQVAVNVMPLLWRTVLHITTVHTTSPVVTLTYTQHHLVKVFLQPQHLALPALTALTGQVPAVMNFTRQLVLLQLLTAAMQDLNMLCRQWTGRTVAHLTLPVTQILLVIDILRAAAVETAMTVSTRTTPFLLLLASSLPYLAQLYTTHIADVDNVSLFVLIESQCWVVVVIWYYAGLVDVWNWHSHPSVFHSIILSPFPC